MGKNLKPYTNLLWKGRNEFSNGTSKLSHLKQIYFMVMNVQSAVLVTALSVLMIMIFQVPLKGGTS
jgi:hypothetical protein